MTFIRIALLALAVEVMVLAKQNRALRGETPEHIKTGVPFILGSFRPVLGTNSLDASSSLLLFIFSTRCECCQTSVLGWQQIAQIASSVGFQVAGISVDSIDATAKLVEENQIRYPVFTIQDSRGFKERNGVKLVSQTVLRSPTGFVQRVGGGASSDSLRSMIQKGLDLGIN